MNYAEAIAQLYSLQQFGAKLGLAKPRRLAELAGSPHEKLKFIHVAGTNGKGSTCAFLESIYRHAGYRTGLFTSPHLVSFRERIRIAGEPIPEDEVARLASGMQPLLQQFAASAHPTFFEVVTVMALQYFAECGCGIVLLETGLGGRLDATNIVNPLAGLITTVDLDHQRWLGDTLEAIALEKAGIIKPGVPVISGEMRSPAREVIRETATRLGAPLTEMDPTTASSDHRLQNLPLAGRHQIANAWLAVTAVELLREPFPVEAPALATGLEATQFPARFQILEHRGSTIVLDGAHNTAGARALAETFTARFPGRKATLVIGMLNERSPREICLELLPLAGRILVSPVPGRRGADPAGIVAVFRELAPDLEIAEAKDAAAALDRAADDPLVLASGSLHFLGECLKALNPPANPTPDETGLNDYFARP